MVFESIFPAIFRSPDPNVMIEDEYIRRPILIIPGFMSSGLEIVNSEIHPQWNQKRLWLNLASLGAERLGRITRQPWQRAHEGLSEFYQRHPALPSSHHHGSPTTKEQIRTASPAQGENIQTAEVAADTEEDIQDPEATAVASSLSAQQQQQQQQQIRSLWLQHMMLQPDLKTERPGMRVRPIPGLAGVDYLYPSFLTSMVTYVFGPLVRYLVEEGGYVADVNLQAAPWDWRLPPSALETRDHYFTNCLNQIEELYQTSGNQPVVILGHSLGSQVGHALLQFALPRKGQAWIDTFVYSYMPVSGTHLGVPKAIKQVVLVDHSCLDPFLTLEEEVLFGRHLGSTPWMFPNALPTHHPPIAFVKRQRLLHVNVSAPLNVSGLIPNRRRLDRPTEYQLQAVMGSPSSSSSKSLRVLTSAFVKVKEEDATIVDCSSQRFTFCFPEHVEALGVSKWQVQFYIREPGVVNTRKDQVVSHGMTALLWKPLSCLDWIIHILGTILEWVCCVLDVAIFPLHLLNQMTVDASSILAVAEAIPLPSPPSGTSTVAETSSNTTMTTTADLIHIHDSHASCFHRPTQRRQTSMSVTFQWESYDDALPPEQLCDSGRAMGGDTTSYQLIDIANVDTKTSTNTTTTQTATYQGLSGHDLMYKEGLDMQRYLRAMKDCYDNDLIFQTSKAPPVKRVHAVYGINIPTEVSAFYRQSDRCHSETEILPKYELDPSPGIELQVNNSKDVDGPKYQVDGYLLKEVPTSTQKTGDGTVPYWSLSSVQNWKDQVESITVHEMEQAEHRDILGSKAFQQHVLD